MGDVKSADMTESTSFGQCRCCLTEGNHTELKSKCSLNGELEVYYNIFVQCFNLQLKTHPELTTLICSQCVERLQDAHDFRSMVVQVEKQLLDDASFADFHMGEADKQPTVVEPHMTAAIAVEIKKEKEDDEPASHLGLSEELDIKMETKEADEIVDEDPEVQIVKEDSDIKIEIADNTITLDSSADVVPVGKTKKSRGEILEQQKLRQRRRREKIKNDPELHAAYKEQHRQKYYKRKKKGDILPINEETPARREQLRERNRDNFRAYYKRQKEKASETTEKDIFSETEPILNVNFNPDTDVDPLALNSPPIPKCSRSKRNNKNEVLPKTPRKDSTDQKAYPEKPNLHMEITMEDNETDVDLNVNSIPNEAFDPLTSPSGHSLRIDTEQHHYTSPKSPERDTQAIDSKISKDCKVSSPHSSSKNSRKSKQTWTVEGIMAAIMAVQNRQLSLKAAAAKFNVPNIILRKHIIKEIVTSKPIFTNEQEAHFVAKMKIFQTSGVPLTVKFFWQQAYLYCEKIKKCKFSQAKKLFGQNWLRGFLKRNPSIRLMKETIGR